MSCINIVIWSGDSWILSRLADSLAKGIPGARKVDVSEYAKIDAHGVDINYYINDWACRRKSRSGALDIVFFDHPKGHLECGKIKVDRAVAMCPQYQRMLIQRQIPTDLVIQPTDTLLYTPKVKLCYVGRYKGVCDYGDRKGRNILEKLEKLSYVEIKYSMGNIPEKEMPNFIRNSDAAIAPGKTEGGPMILTEALACGVPVIMDPRVGVGEVFKEGIIPIDASNFASVKEVIDQIYEKKMQLRKLVEKYTWDFWIEQHIRIFDRLVFKPKVCLFTTAIGEYGKVCGEISIPLMKQYAKNQGWEFHCFTEQGSHLTPSWVRVEIPKVMKEKKLDYGIYVDLDGIINPEAPSILNDLPKEGWDIAAWNHGEHPRWNPNMAKNNIERYCLETGQSVPRGYTGRNYFNAGVLVYSKSCINKVYDYIESVNGCQDQEALNLDVIRERLIWHKLPRKWNWGHLDDVEIPGIFEKAHLVHCHRASMAPCTMNGRVELMRSVYNSYLNSVNDATYTESPGR